MASETQQPGELIVWESAAEQTVLTAAPGQGDALELPRIVTDQGERTTKRFLEFFTANIRNKNTRAAYARAVMQFMAWCEERGVALTQIEPMVVAAYIEQHPGQAQTVKQHLAAIRMLFDWLVIGQAVPFNPATSVRGPRYSYKKGKTPVLSGDEARHLLESIETKTIMGLRDRALIGVMVYTFARVSAVIGMRVEDYCQRGRRMWVQLHEKGGKYHEVPLHHSADEYLHAYIEAAGIGEDKKGPLFRTIPGIKDRITANAMQRTEVLLMIKRRAKAAGLPEDICCHTFRATGITAYLENKGTIEHAQQIAAHESPRTTKLYDRRGDEISLDEIEKIVL